MNNMANTCRKQSCFNLQNFPMTREFLAEFLGTFILLVFGEGSVAQVVLSEGKNGSPQSIYWSWGIGVTMGIYVSGGVSGGHLNPAVTVAQAALGRLQLKKVPVYLLAQYLGAFVASILVYLVYTDALHHYDDGVRAVVGNVSTAGIWATYPQPFVSTANGFGDQVFGTAILLICVMGVTDPRNMSPPSGLIPISVGLIVVAIGMTFGFNCGYAINPARDLGPRIFTAVAGWGSDPFSFRGFNWFWVPILGPHIGAILGAYFYQACVGFHWPTEVDISSDTKDSSIDHFDGMEQMNLAS
ncbi:aquaporin-10-like isoform X1 [Haliotis cracherodii]|uniref:aquaporin-10-like isoform X1 n=1 Tax=Haliotis cracherodii TaxID=6455 RepID=UPI0039EC5F01